MVLLMARPTKRSGSDKHQFRKRIPADVLGVARGKRIMFSLPKTHTGDESIRVSAKIGVEVLISLRTEDDALATLRQGRALEQFERAIAAFREGPRALTHKQHIELAGIIYRDLASGFEDEPVSAGWWQIVAEVAQRVLTPPPGPSLMIETFPGEAQLVELEKYVGPFLDAILFREGVIPTKEDRPKLLRAFAKALIDAANKLRRNAEGDYTPDDVVVRRYPKWEGVDVVPPNAIGSGSSPTLKELFHQWREHPDQQAVTVSTFASYSTTIEKFSDFIVKRHGSEPAAAVLVRGDFQAFIEMRSTDDRVSAATINNLDLSAINAVLNWAVAQGRLAANPAEGLKRKERKGASAGTRKTINDAEARAILRHALDYSALPRRGESPKLTAAKRWVPWIMAYTGLRVGEVAQLRKCDVGDYEGHPAISISMEAGTVKTKSTWHVPLHPHLIEQGFLKFVETAPDGHLFLTPRPDRYKDDAPLSRTTDPRGILGPLQGVKNRLGEFTREVMPNVGNGPSPNHGWRHRFKAKARENGIDREVRDAFADHAPDNVAACYGKDELYKAMVAALAKIPRYEVE